MNKKIRQFSIAFTSFFACAGFTVITPFYPAVAERAGVPSSIIGLVFSTFPIASITISLFLPKIMFRFGRNIVLILGMLTIGISNILVAFLEDVSPPIAIILSFTTRALSGIGGACTAISSTSMLSSDYPDDFKRLVAIIEVFTGLGIIAGPLVGSLLFSFGGFFISCIVIGISVILYVPILLPIIGRSREYVIDEREKISMKSLISKPVRLTQKVMLNFFMGFMIMIAIGVNMPVIEMHLISYGVEERYIGYWLMIYTGAYLISSALMTREYKVSKKKMMLSGVFLYSLSFFLIGPCPFIFPRNLVLVGIGHHLMGWACSIQYIPLIPYLIEVSHKEYLIPNDDRLNDAISGIVNISIGCGEIAGPILGSMIPYLFSKEVKYRMTYLIVSILFFGYGVIYILVNRRIDKGNSSRKNTGEEELLELKN